MKENTDNATITISSECVRATAQIVKCMPCLICGETVEVGEHWNNAVICDKCRAAVIKVRNEMENGTSSGV